ncbi:MAG TPA: hypothetical protein VJA19_02540, partial [Pseudomonas sp.]|nr:hypothetical protein [Pseudomonas sp.]
QQLRQANRQRPGWRISSAGLAPVQSGQHLAAGMARWFSVACQVRHFLRFIYGLALAWHSFLYGLSAENLSRAIQAQFGAEHRWAFSTEFR